MESILLKQKLIDQFNSLLEDQSKWLIMNDFFEMIEIPKLDSYITDEHYKIVNERREAYLKNKKIGLKWEEVKLQLMEKHGK